MRINKLAKAIGVTPRHASRMARAGVIPNTKTRRSGQRYFVRGAALNRWINKMRYDRDFWNKTVSEAYKRGYGNVLAFQKQEIKLMRRGFKDVEQFANEPIKDLTRVLRWLPGSPEPRLKRLLSKRIRQRVILLRTLIDKWLESTSP
jgi:hypothetical protein